MDSLTKEKIKEHYIQKGWVHISSYHNIPDSDKVMDQGIPLRQNYYLYSNWLGISCASRFSSVLAKAYTSQKMYDLSRLLIGENVNLFNDQIVIKMPNDSMTFEPHYDNQYGPNKDNKVHTVNCCWILSDYDKTNGTLEVQNRDNGKWVTLYPKKGDIVAICGDTYHRSGENKGEEPRGLYACVYTESPIYLENFYYQSFYKVCMVGMPTSKETKEI